MSTNEFENSFKNVPVPSSANFSVWQQKVKLLLSSAGVWTIVMPKDQFTGLRPVRPVPADPAAPTSEERHQISRYDLALSKSVAAIATAAGDNYLSMANPFIDENNPGGLWDALEARLASQ